MSISILGLPTAFRETCKTIACHVDIYLAGTLDKLAGAGLLMRVIPSEDPGQFLKASQHIS